MSRLIDNAIAAGRCLRCDQHSLIQNPFIPHWRHCPTCSPEVVMHFPGDTFKPELIDRLPAPPGG